ncbi:Nif3-like dinuclear metal center hexameric protein [Undibacterium fentianense]|uniref:Nif3-like dinuclear metal center hexameric protein n=1 Tax=Undibacterium fentianense TaxID=2828728 RepID=A0A941E6U7_9BURK|nr:Nif3-like dinuclear metal center hexameric protein [Undibacterium fentianense]MBR7800833.1 Nif3-like dinuclear metal center hexameric protein [Undibacterium fentianense]
MLNKSVERKALAQFLDKELQVARFRDYCPNGLQVEGRDEIKRIVSGVTACQTLLDRAVELRADAVLVHHGYFWRGEDTRIVGQKLKRLKTLIDHSMSLFAYHLPLDSHPSLGNNAQLAQLFGFDVSARFGEDELGWLGHVQSESISKLSDLCTHLSSRLGREVLAIGNPDQVIETIAWCSGAAQNMLSAAIESGASVFISGEISEPTVHLARESGVAYISAGHHATERYGVKALGQRIAEEFGIEHYFVDVDNPV